MDDVVVTFPKMPFEVKVFTCNQSKSARPCLTGGDFDEIASKQYFKSFMGMQRLDLKIYHRKATSSFVRIMSSFQPLTDHFSLMNYKMRKNLVAQKEDKIHIWPARVNEFIDVAPGETPNRFAPILPTNNS